MKLVLIGVAGAFGTVLRHVTGVAAHKWLGGAAFPAGTITVNVIGSFLMGLLMTIGSTGMSPQTRAVLGTGLLGGFTTYSSFNQDTLTLMQRSAPLAALNLIATVAGCLLAGAGGMRLGRALLGGS